MGEICFIVTGEENGKPATLTSKEVPWIHGLRCRLITFGVSHRYIQTAGIRLMAETPYHFHQEK